MIAAGCSSEIGSGANDGSVANGGGTVTCTSTSDCGGRDCEHITGRASGACVDHCTTAPCAVGYRCVTGSSVGLEASCLVDCSRGATCAPGFVCGTNFAGVSGVCIPAAWSGTSSPPTGSGTVICARTSDCGGRDCEHITGRTSGVCVDHCTTAPCASGHRCATLASIGLEASCLIDCANGAACASGFRCQTTYRVCVPAEWDP